MSNPPITRTLAMGFAATADLFDDGWPAMSAGLLKLERAFAYELMTPSSQALWRIHSEMRADAWTEDKKALAENFRCASLILLDSKHYVPALRTAMAETHSHAAHDHITGMVERVMKKRAHLKNRRVENEILEVLIALSIDATTEIRKETTTKMLKDYSAHLIRGGHVDFLERSLQIVAQASHGHALPMQNVYDGMRLRIQRYHEQHPSAATQI